MKTLTYIFLLIAAAFHCHGQQDPAEAGSLLDGKFVLKVNLEWNKQQQAEFSSLYDLDSVMVKQLFNRNFDYFNTHTAWKLHRNNDQFVVLSQEIQRDTTGGKISRMLILNETYHDTQLADIKPDILVSGGNSFNSEQAFRYLKGKACFFLAGFEKSSKVFIAGTFNNWSTISTPMQFTGKGWNLCLPLPVGKYSYKFVVDGRWYTDPFNNNKERDGNNGYNSVVYCPNYTFKLKGYTDAKQVMVAGSFNNWHDHSLKMKKTEYGWELPLYLKEGTHAYKFIVDGAWMNDPENRIIRPDGRGNLNSFLGLGDTLVFHLKGFRQAKEVYLSGSFNGWNSKELAMDQTADGWKIAYHLAPGYYEYKFIVDGQWITDPANPDKVGTGEYANSFISFKPNKLFKLDGYANAKTIRLSGSFNRWSHEGYPMTFRNGSWQLALYLPPGRYSYKFIVDGKWIPDEANPLWEENEYGESNSVIWVEYP